MHHRGGMEATLPRWHPSGMQFTFLILTGGIAALNHRLMADIPLG